MKRRGVALVLVLLVLVVAVTAAVAVAQLSVSARLRAAASDRSQLAMSLLRGADDRIHLFLSGESGMVVLPPDVPEPRLLVVDDSLDLDGARCRIRINAHDQCGMAPWGLVRPGSQLRASLPAEVASAWDAVAHAPGPGPSGLDIFEHGSSVGSWSVFPTSDGSPAAGSLVATHNPDRPLISGDTMFSDAGLINVNTAPRPLLERAVRACGASGLEEILTARARGEPSAAPPTGIPSGDGGDGRSPPVGIRLVSQSDCWAFRVDFQIGSSRRSWWCVYRATGSQWRCVQRVLVSE